MSGSTEVSSAHPVANALICLVFLQRMRISIRASMHLVARCQAHSGVAYTLRRRSLSEPIRPSMGGRGAGRRASACIYRCIDALKYSCIDALKYSTSTSMLDGRTGVCPPKERTMGRVVCTPTEIFFAVP